MDYKRMRVSFIWIMILAAICGIGALFSNEASMVQLKFFEGMVWLLAISCGFGYLYCSKELEAERHKQFLQRYQVEKGMHEQCEAHNEARTVNMRASNIYFNVFYVLAFCLPLIMYLYLQSLKNR